MLGFAGSGEQREKLLPGVGVIRVEFERVNEGLAGFRQEAAEDQGAAEVVVVGGGVAVLGDGLADEALGAFKIAGLAGEHAGEVEGVGMAGVGGEDAAVAVGCLLELA